MLWLTKGVSIRLLARTAGRTWVRCCSGRAIRNSESLRELRGTLQERRGRGKARALPGPLAVRTYRTGAKALPCQSRADESDGSEGFVGSKPCGRWLRLGSRQSRADVSDGSEGFAVPKPCGRIGRERRLCRVKAVRTSGQAQRLCRVKAVRTSGQARRPRLRWVLS